MPWDWTPKLTDPPLLKGIARDLIRHIQTLRKQAGLRVEERIAVWISGHSGERVERAIQECATYLMEETLAVSLNSCPIPAAALRAQIEVAVNPVELALEKQEPDSR